MKKKHKHRFQIERIGFNDKTKIIEFLDIWCECGLAVFTSNPTTHRGDLPERKLKTTDL